MILAICFFLAWKNYTSGTWLSGWDNLHPEFNFKLNIIRSLNSAWQEYQGLGLLGGMAHAADLPRQLFLWLVSVFIPVSFVRYLWTFLMLGTGPLGAYFLIKSLSSRVGGFAGAVFYLLNLATVQYYYVPFETFIGFFGFLPWLLYFAVGYLRTGKNLITYLLISILATSAFYVQTMFVVYCLFLLVFSLEATFSLKLTGITRSIKLALVAFAANAFWLLPVIWFSLTSGQIPVNSQINRIASSETVYMNQAREDFLSIANLKGYWFDYYDFSKNGQFDYLFADWISHTNNIWVERTGVFLFATAILGLILMRKFAWLIVFGVAYLMLTGFKFPLPLLAEAFRNSFTKWSVALSFVISLGLGAFVSKFRKFSVIPAILIIGACVFSVSPVFNGKLISERMKVDIPNEYFALFKWFETEPQDGRIAFFPFFNFWGWNYHSWGYDGSGFLWYGIKQPILDRAFNVWSPYNETYQNEITYALSNKDNVNFENTLKKFEVKYLLLDESIIYPGSGNNNLFISELKEMVASSSGRIKEVEKFGFITVFETDVENNKFISVPESYALVNSDMNYSQLDFVYSDLGTYVKATDAVSYPFANFDRRMGMRVYRDGEKINIESAKYNAKATFPVVGIIKEDFNLRRGFETPRNCDLKGKGSVRRVYLKDKVIYASENGGVSCDYFYFPEVSFSQGYILRIKGKNSLGRGLKIYLQNNERGNMDIEELLPTGEFDEYFFIFPNISKSKAGYTLNVETRSFGTVPSENSIENIEFIPVDTVLLSRLIQNSEKMRTYKRSLQEPRSYRNNLKIIAVDKVGTYLYRVQTKKEGLLVLGQGYNDGWLAFRTTPEESLPATVRGVARLEHVKVNSWENGWTVPGDNSIVYILFWPQLLEWGGLLILFGSTVILIISGKKRISRFPVDRGKR